MTGTHNGTAHNVSTDAVSVTSSTDKRSSMEPVKRSDSSKSESEKDSRLKLMAAASTTAIPLVKSVSADRMAVNSIAEGAPHQRLTPNQIISKASAVDKLNRKNSAGTAGNNQILPDLGETWGARG